MAGANILVGTASWTDRSLVDSGRYYPQDVKTPEDGPSVEVLQELAIGNRPDLAAQRARKADLLPRAATNPVGRQSGHHF